MAADESIQTAVACFYKMASGLGPEHLNFDLGAFLSHLEHLEQMPRKEVMAQFSHPVTPVRARALQLYTTVASSGHSLADVDAEVSRLTALMEFEASTDQGVQIKRFLIAAGLLASYADGEPNQQEKEIVVQLLLQVTGDPEGALATIKSAQEARRLLDESCAWLSANAGQERFALFAQIANVVAIDGSVTSGERAFMMSLAAQLGIPEKAANEALHEVLSRYVRSKAATGKVGFGFGGGA
jgi:tellurite resistance protein